MNWEALGALGEIFGAIAVVVTLLYLSRQLTEHTKSLNIQSLNTTFDEWNSILAEIQSIDGIGTAYRKIQTGQDLDEDEEWELTWMFRRIFNVNDKILYLHSIGAADKFNRDTFERSLRVVVVTDFFGNWWSEYKNRYSDPFQSYIDELITIESKK